MPIPVAHLKKEMEVMLNKSMGLATVWGWVVGLSDPPYVSRTQWWADEVMHQGEKDTYYVEAQDQLEAFSKAMKLQEETNGRSDNRL
jgi:hypothetical protein